MSDSHRLAALRLQELTAADRKWMLERLPDSDREIVDRYLDELKGFTVDAETLDALHRQLNDSNKSSESEIAVAFQSHIIEKVLSLEPSWLASIVRPRAELHSDGVVSPLLTSKALKAIDSAFMAQVQSVDGKRRPAGYQRGIEAPRPRTPNKPKFFDWLKSAWHR